MTLELKLWVDDQRLAPPGFEFHAWDAWHALAQLSDRRFTHVSLDHDLGCFLGEREVTGYDIMQWMCAKKAEGIHMPRYVSCHSANPAGKTRIDDLIRKHGFIDWRSL